ncbi:MAG: arylsulfatase [Planctomycetota bacterium]
MSRTARRLTLWLTAAVLCAPSSGAERPNVVLILADDMGWGDLGCYNPESRIETPAMDRIAAQGIRLTDAHSPSAVCTPTRYGLLTGRYCWRSSLKSSVLLGFSPALIEPERFTLADLFQQAGYSTACVGKWHIGLDWTLRSGEPVTERYFRDGARIDFDLPFGGGPLELGFDYFFGCSACATTDPLYSFLEGDRTVGIPSEQWKGQSVEHPHQDDKNWRPGIATPGWKHEEVDPTFVGKALAWVEEQASQERPFFLYLPLSAPHAPWLPPEITRGKSQEGPRGDMVAVVDWAVGEVVDALDRLDLRENTLLIVTSDNGPRIGLNGHRSAGPWRGYKSHTWEGGHRIPFLARWPGHIPKGATSDEPVCLTDMLSSLATILGESLPADAAEDSYDVSPVLLGEEHESPIREALVSHSVTGAFTIRQAQWKLILGTRGSGGWVPPADSTRPVDMQLGQLFDLDADPAEERDLFDQRPKVVARLRALLQSYRESGRSRPVR